MQKSLLFHRWGIDMLSTHFEYLIMEYSQFYQLYFSHLECSQWPEAWNTDLVLFLSSRGAIYSSTQQKTSINKQEDDEADLELVKQLVKLIDEEEREED